MDVLLTKGSHLCLWEAGRGPQAAQIGRALGIKRVLQNRREQAMDADYHQRRGVVDSAKLASVQENALNACLSQRAVALLQGDPGFGPQIE